MVCGYILRDSFKYRKCKLEVSSYTSLSGVTGTETMITCGGRVRVRVSRISSYVSVLSVKVCDLRWCQ